jgi:hypothetical protein
MRLLGRKISGVSDSPHNQTIILEVSLRNKNMSLGTAMKILAEAV